MTETRPVAVILAAGVGSRLRPLTDDRPKCLVPVAGVSIIHRAIAHLAHAGVAELVVSTGYCESTLQAALRDSPLQTRFVANSDFATTQNVVSLGRALRAVPPGRAVIKFDGDVLFRPALLQRLLACDGNSAVAVERSSRLGEEEMKVRVADDRVVEFGKRIAPLEAYGESIGIELLTARDVATVSEAIDRAVRNGRTDVYYEDVYNNVLDRVAMCVCAVTADEWTEIDTRDDLDRANTLFVEPG